MRQHVEIPFLFRMNSRKQFLDIQVWRTRSAINKIYSKMFHDLLHIVMFLAF